MPSSRLQKSDIQYCKKILQQHGKAAYRFSTLFFPKDIRDATYVLYAFFRIPDEFVDHPEEKNPAVILEKLHNWKREWQRAYQTGDSAHPALRSTAYIFHKYTIPYEYSESFLTAMIQDVSVARYKTYKDVERYMYGSAAVVGLIMAHVIGCDKKGFHYAEQLGYAMQYTNFLRDIREDYHDIGRIYLAKETLDAFGVTEIMIEEGSITPECMTCMQSQIARARNMFEEADKGIPYLAKHGRFPVMLASRLYAQILDVIESNQYDVFTKKASVSLWQKIKTIFEVYGKTK